MKMQTLKCLFAFGAMLAGGLAFGDGFGTPVGEASEEVVANFDTRNLKVRTPATMEEFFNVAWNNTEGWTADGNTNAGAPSATVTIEPMSGTDREDYADWTSAGASKVVVSATGEGVDDVSSHIRRSLYKFTLAAQGIATLSAYFDFGDAVPEVKPGVEITSVRLRDPRDGTVEYSYKVDGEFEEGEYDVLIKVSVANGTKSTVLTHKSVAGGSTVSTNLNVQTLFGKAYPNVALFAELKKALRGVQLWEGGPIWAECNVGATKPEEYGYYFWWGDTVGYVRNESSWDAVDGSKTGFSFSSSSKNCPTYNKTLAQLYSGGYIDVSSTDGKLNPEYDAARKYLKGDWRMPTNAEFILLISRCNRTWTTRNGVNGYVVTGTGDYATNSIFLPAAGNGNGTSLSYSGSSGYYWSSTPNATEQYAWNFYFNVNSIGRSGTYRYYGFPVRPVRDAK